MENAGRCRRRSTRDSRAKYCKPPNLKSMQFAPLSGNKSTEFGGLRGNRSVGSCDNRNCRPTSTQLTQGIIPQDLADLLQNRGANRVDLASKGLEPKTCIQNPNHILHSMLHTRSLTPKLLPLIQRSIDPPPPNSQPLTLNPTPYTPSPEP